MHCIKLMYECMNVIMNVLMETLDLLTMVSCKCKPPMPKSSDTILTPNVMIDLTVVPYNVVIFRHVHDLPDRSFCYPVKLR